MKTFRWAVRNYPSPTDGQAFSAPNHILSTPLPHPGLEHSPLDRMRLLLIGRLSTGCCVARHHRLAELLPGEAAVPWPRGQRTRGSPTGLLSCRLRVHTRPPPSPALISAPSWGPHRVPSPGPGPKVCLPITQLWDFVCAPRPAPPPPVPAPPGKGAENPWDKVFLMHLTPPGNVTYIAILNTQRRISGFSIFNTRNRWHKVM